MKIKSLFSLQALSIVLVSTSFTALIIAGCSLTIVASSSDQPKKFEDAKPGDCTACHGNTTVLPAGHDNTIDMGLSQCDTCHKANSNKGDKKAPVIRGKIPLGHLHLLSDVSCTDCHGTSGPAAALTRQECYSCHDSLEEIISRTEAVIPNPHDNHYGETDCDLCHKQHTKPENFCNQPGCHNYDYVVP